MSQGRRLPSRTRSAHRSAHAQLLCVAAAAQETTKLSSCFFSNAINFEPEVCPDMTATLSPTQWTSIPSRWVSRAVLLLLIRVFPWLLPGTGTAGRDNAPRTCLVGPWVWPKIFPGMESSLVINMTCPWPLLVNGSVDLMFVMLRQLTCAGKQSYVQVLAGTWTAPSQLRPAIDANKDDHLFWYLMAPKTSLNRVHCYLQVMSTNRWWYI